MDDMSEYTSRLFAMPSYLSGAARTLDLAGRYDAYNMSSDEATADADALRADFLATAEDFNAAVKSLIPN